ncbi:MAG: glycosyltransferase family 2 protein [Leptolyngbyaceae cyanobacterium bins.302]|nr:glycosyltransferase family 2 protein [Leptolyngbyaceae cyanobacterium bins.302]
MTTITTIVPTYRRPADLARCLTALRHQLRSPDEVLVVVRDTDNETRQFLELFDHAPLPLRVITVTVTGVVAAMNMGLDAAQGDIIAFTDDDAAPHPDWLTRIEQHFLADDRVGGVGGRDLMYCNGAIVEGAKQTVGQLQWFGRVIGNHHLGTGTAREVDVLKGVNMSFRRTAIANSRFDTRMRGTGAQVHFEIEFSLSLKRAGWTLIYDPHILVDHYPAQRFDEDQRHTFNEVAFANAVHNETLALLEHLAPEKRLLFVLWATFVGTRKAFGFVQLLRFTPHEKHLAWKKWQASVQGRWQGWQTWQHSQRNPRSFNQSFMQVNQTAKL